MWGEEEESVKEIEKRGRGRRARRALGPREEGSYEKRNLRGCDGSSKMKIESGTELAVGTSLVTMG